MMHTMMEPVLEKLKACEASCNMCFSACLEEEHVKMMARCIRLDRDCADICALTASVLQRKSEHAQHYLTLCAEVCRACGEECAKHDMEHCQECARACRECEEACRTAMA